MKPISMRTNSHDKLKQLFFGKRCSGDPVALLPMSLLSVLFLTFMAILANTASSAAYDIIVRRGTLYDGSGRPGIVADLAIKGDSIAALGNLQGSSAKMEVDAKGLAVAPGFINMLSWATESLLQDGRSQSDIRQGVTLEIFGEGESMGPLNPAMKQDLLNGQGDIKFDIPWTTLSEYLEYLAQRGVSPNIGSFVGATTVRIHEIGYANRPPTPAELDRMRQHVRKAMEEGALGVGASLIYAPAFYAQTEELIALAKETSAYGGIYISHIRSEGNRLLEAADELIQIAKAAKIQAQIYHLKAAGESNWKKIDALIAKIEAARKSGLRITADMYTYTAGATGLDASMPPWVQEGGYNQWVKRLKDPAIRERVKREMSLPADEWENFFVAAGSPEKILLVQFKNEKLKPYTGKSLAEVARLRNTSPQDTAMDLVIEDGTRVGTVYFLMSEDNVRKQLRLPWVSFDSDAGSMAPEGPFLLSNPHPRAYGNFARLLGKYVRDEKVLPLEEAVRRLTSFPAETLHLERRGALKPGYFADVVVFDPAKIQDHATFDKPHQYATGMAHVFVNGVQVLQNGEHTGKKPGRVVRGPGYKRSLPRVTP
ncbi:MAG: N-acyl-D-amino-acid deacylase [Verrucomicrobiales bacterium]|nr:N-acyl-D-amino-acid deacylase [Verrucomicrobiales bacterium]